MFSRQKNMIKLPRYEGPIAPHSLVLAVDFTGQWCICDVEGRSPDDDLFLIHKGVAGTYIKKMQLIDRHWFINRDTIVCVVPRHDLSYFIDMMNDMAAPLVEQRQKFLSKVALLA